MCDWHYNAGHWRSSQAWLWREMRANYANIKKRYCEKLGEQVLWDDFDDFVPVLDTICGRVCSHRPDVPECSACPRMH